MLRPRVVLYPAALAFFVGSLVYALATRQTAEVTLLRGIGEPFTQEPDGRIANQIRIKVQNRSDADHAYTIALADAGGATMIAPENPLTVSAGDVRTTSVFLLLAPGAVHHGATSVTFRIHDEGAFRGDFPYRLVGPEHEDDSHETRDAEKRR